MPELERSYEPALGSGASADVEVLRKDALAVLTDESLSHMVDVVAYLEHDGPDAGIVVSNCDGASRISLADVDAPAELLRGRDPIANQDPLHFAGIISEMADPSPPNLRNAYPLAGRRLASLFSDRRAPDIAVVHTGRHYWPERGGHIGEHGSLNVIQSRAPFILSGVGVHASGVVDSWARVVDVAATLGWLSGLSPDSLADLDGTPQTSYVDADASRYVVGLLWDGANSNDVIHLAQTGELPNAARLLDRGCALSGGAVAEFPSNTLCNHTAALTGVGPGRHGIVNNVYWDREERRQIQANEAGTWHVATELIRPGVTTLFERIASYDAAIHTACVNEPVDRGAGYSTFALIRAAGHTEGAKAMSDALPDPNDDPHATHEYTSTDVDYKWSSQVDALGLVQVMDLWRTAENAPQFMWWNTTLTDTGHHNGGPHSETSRAALRDADRRLGDFLDQLDKLGVFDQTVFLLTADHGSEGADPECRGDWDEHLRAEGIPFRDEAYGYIYLGTS